jgi:hypothetical protein
MILEIENSFASKKKEIIMKKVLSMTMLTILATTLAVAACPCCCKQSCPCPLRPATVVKPVSVLTPAVTTPVVAVESVKVEPKVKKNFAKKLKFWAKN